MTAAATRTRKTAALVVEGLRKRFGEVEVLAGVGLRLRKAAITALLGPNGAGKRTLTDVGLFLRPLS